MSNCDWSEGEKSYNQYYFVKTSERNWTESVIKLPAGTNGTAGTKASYVYFGDWPQTIRNKNIPVDTTETITRGGYTYYKGSDNYWYAFCEENGANGDGKYSNGDSVQLEEEYKYFRVEPIKWRVLKEDYDGNGNALLLAENILTANVPYYSGSDRTINGNAVYASNYKYSTIRAYLNGSYEDDDTQATTYAGTGFLQTAFTDDAQDLIVETSVDNSAESRIDYDRKITSEEEYACANTVDKIFLLSAYEATNPDYGFAEYNNNDANNIRRKKQTDFALANYAWYSKYSPNSGMWLLRSPGMPDSEDATAVKKRAFNVSGDGNFTGNWECSKREISIVPALTIALP